MNDDAYLADLLDELVTAEPPPAWSDVLRRARRSRRRYGLVAVVLAALVLAPASWAVANAFEGSAPPELITSGVADSNALAPQVVAAAEAKGWPDPASYGATADLSKLHGVMQLQTPDGPLDLWAAPSSNGGVCEFLGFEVDLRPGANGGWDGGCLNPPLKLFPPTLENESWHPNLYYEYGYTSIPNAATATMSLTDGQSATVPVVEGWFLTTFQRTTDGVFSTTTTIQDASGNQLAEYQAPPPPKDWYPPGSNAAPVGAAAAPGATAAASAAPGAAAAAAAAAGATASGYGIRICGPHKSVAVKSALAQSVPTAYVAGLRAAAPARPQSFYKIQLDVSRSCNVSFPNAPIAFYVPAAAEVRILGATGAAAFWVHLPRNVNNVLREAAHRVKPFPAPRTLASAEISHQLAAKPSTYLRLYTVGTPVRRAPGAGSWNRITLTGPSSPWSDGWNSLRISRLADYLSRDGQLVRIPASVAVRIRRGAPIPR